MEMEVMEEFYKKLRAVENMRAFEAEEKLFLVHHTPKKLVYYVVKDLRRLMQVNWQVKRGRIARLSKEWLECLEPYKD
jgi:hypothetical protein